MAKHPDSYNDEMLWKLARTTGTGAAGGLVGAILACFDKARTVSGMEFVNDICNLDERISNTDLVLTGEGSIDE